MGFIWIWLLCSSIFCCSISLCDLFCINVNALYTFGRASRESQVLRVTEEPMVCQAWRWALGEALSVIYIYIYIYIQYIYIYIYKVIPTKDKTYSKWVTSVCLIVLVWFGLCISQGDVGEQGPQGEPVRNNASYVYSKCAQSILCWPLFLTFINWMQGFQRHLLSVILVFTNIQLCCKLFLIILIYCHNRKYPLVCSTQFPKMKLNEIKLLFKKIYIIHIICI